MPFIMSVCTDPDAMTILRLVNILLTLIKIFLPLAIIVVSSVEFGKAVIAGSFDNLRQNATKLGNRLIAAVIVFFIPTLVSLVFSFISTTETVNVAACFENATPENIQAAYVRKADLALVKAEASLNTNDLNDAEYAVSQLTDGTTKSNYEARIETVKKTIEDKRAQAKKIAASKKASSSSSSNVTGSGQLKVSGSYSSSGNATTKGGITLTSEPDPSAALNYWKSYVNSSNFIYPKDEATGLPLGAWPKNYASIPTQISGYKTYKNTFIFPITPANGVYNYVYEHNGIDIMAEFGTPVYSPVDGTLVYSEWGHTRNKGSDETAYTVSIELDEAITISGVSVKEVFLTHMCGIRYRCKTGACNRTVKKGELLGFAGNASGDSTSIGWAPHLHMTLYPKGRYKSGLTTSKIQNDLYGISSGTSIKVGG